MTRTISFFAVGAGVLALAACGGSTSAGTPTASTTTHQTAHQAAVACKQQYDAWKTGPAKAIETGQLQPALREVQSAGASEDVPELQSGLEKAGRAATAMEAYPMPSCADPAGYWRQVLALLKASGDNAKTGSGLGALILAEAPLEKVKPLDTKLTAELKKDASAAAG